MPIIEGFFKSSSLNKRDVEFVATRLDEIRQILDAVAGSGEEASDGESEPEETPSAVLSPPPTNQSNKPKNLQQVLSSFTIFPFKFVKTNVVF